MCRESESRERNMGAERRDTRSSHSLSIDATEPKEQKKILGHGENKRDMSRETVKEPETDHTPHQSTHVDRLDRSRDPRGEETGRGDSNMQRFGFMTGAAYSGNVGGLGLDGTHTHAHTHTEAMHGQAHLTPTHTHTDTHTHGERERERERQNSGSTRNGLPGVSVLCTHASWGGDFKLPRRIRQRLKHMRHKSRHTHTHKETEKKKEAHSSFKEGKNVNESGDGCVNNNMGGSQPGLPEEVALQCKENKEVLLQVCLSVYNYYRLVYVCL